MAATDPTVDIGMDAEEIAVQDSMTSENALVILALVDHSRDISAKTVNALLSVGEIFATGINSTISDLNVTLSAELVPTATNRFNIWTPTDFMKLSYFRYSLFSLHLFLNNYFAMW